MGMISPRVFSSQCAALLRTNLAQEKDINDEFCLCDKIVYDICLKRACDAPERRTSLHIE